MPCTFVRSHSMNWFGKAIVAHAQGIAEVGNQGLVCDILLEKECLLSLEGAQSHLLRKGVM